MTKHDFKKFVEEKVAEANVEPVNWDEKKKYWLDMLEKLNNKIVLWLEPYTLDKSVQIERKMVPLVEENIGDYQAPSITIKIGNSKITLEPVGTLLFGARGRVDMKGPKGVARLVIVPKNSVEPRIRVEVLSPGQKSKASDVPPDSEWVWKFSTPPPKILYTDLTDESFLDALLGVANGRES